MKNYAILDYYVLQSVILARLRDHCLDAALSGRYSCEISHDEAHLVKITIKMPRLMSGLFPC